MKLSLDLSKFTSFLLILHNSLSRNFPESPAFTLKILKVLFANGKVLSQSFELGSLISELV